MRGLLTVLAVFDVLTLCYINLIYLHGSMPYYYDSRNYIIFNKRIFSVAPSFHWLYFECRLIGELRECLVV